MADDQQQRTTSHAKSVEGLIEQESALDRARSLKEQFNRAQDSQALEQSRQTEQAKGGAQQGSQMVKEDAPAPRPHPQGAMREGPDREASDAKVQKERAAALERAQKLRELHEAQKTSQTRDHEQDRER